MLIAMEMKGPAGTLMTVDIPNEIHGRCVGIGGGHVRPFVTVIHPVCIGIEVFCSMGFKGEGSEIYGDSPDSRDIEYITGDPVVSEPLSHECDNFRGHL